MFSFFQFQALLDSGGRIEEATIEKSSKCSLLVRAVGTTPWEIKQATPMLSCIDSSVACKSTLKSVVITDSPKTTDDDDEAFRYLC